MKPWLLILIYFLSISNMRGMNFPGEGESPSFSKEALQRHIHFLGSDIFEGRGTGTTGGNLAAKYLALEFDKLNLIPMGSNSTYYQYIPMHGSLPLPSSKLSITNNNDTIELKLWDDYVLYKSGEQTFIPNSLPLVFVGYGIIAPEFDYNDYQSIDVDGKIAVMLEGEPLSDDPDYFAGELPGIYSYPESKERLALSRGARGCIIIPGNIDWKKLRNSFSFEDVTLAYSVTANLSVLINPLSADILFKNSPYSLEDIYRMHIENKIISFPLTSVLSFRGEFKERDFVAANIAGMIRGSDPELNDTYIIVTAHYDHLGIGPVIKGDSIYNGVFDNAIGTAALLEIAQEFTLLNEVPVRSVIFILLTGEEKGLLGSTYYTENPIVPLYKTIANVNIDGIALFDKFKSIVGVGSDLSTLKNYLSATAKKFNVDIVSIPPQFNEFESFSKSDQISFAIAGIPSILISEGPDYEKLSKQEGINKLINYSNEIYHTPFDDLSQEMNFDAAIEHMNIIFDFCLRLADSEKEPEWNPGTPFINARLRSNAEKK